MLSKFIPFWNYKSKTIERHINNLLPFMVDRLFFVSGREKYMDIIHEWITEQLLSAHTERVYAFYLSVAITISGLVWWSMECKAKKKRGGKKYGR